ncbi:unnamed protein product [Citrullus colocynthis]|uniref:Uncharacterized protein n=1 Tax=Citrullus colocynthis TaxID=252529 RepID=A0ABP0Y0B9_9ROSI
MCKRVCYASGRGDVMCCVGMLGVEASMWASRAEGASYRRLLSTPGVQVINTSPASVYMDSRAGKQADKQVYKHTNKYAGKEGGHLEKNDNVMGVSGSTPNLRVHAREQ